MIARRNLIYEKMTTIKDRLENNKYGIAAEN